ncbi:nucleoid protein Alba [Thermoplasmatales archaeon SCGC AB-539-N05]|nr:nucleoid protein Alba [Thermoplasmatales archaeon SCGC AB-539-N05]
MAEETTEEKVVAEEKRTDENIIYVGRKPPMSYVLAVVTQFNTSGSDEVILKARGRSISTAVDAAEIVRHRFITDAKVKDIKIDTESITNEEGRTSNVSSMEIILTTKKKSK